MDDFFHSIEFYTLALLVAFALLALIFGQREKSMPSTYIQAMDLEPGQDETGELTLTALDDGTVRLRHSGMMLQEGDTVNVVATLADDSLRMVEKKGRKSPLTGTEQPTTGSTLLKFLKEQQYEVRYESEVTGEWRLFTFVNRSGNVKKISLKY
ncbi:MAG: hypothetical protein II592_00460 [Muribaculaceae bacterium]|nr:hypothetical protein [Muribaculaceae bacterium]MBQ4138004.1 hypothetical protein [Muribaculaceae bacterium]